MTPSHSAMRELQARHLSQLSAIADDIDQALIAIDEIIGDDVIDNDDFHFACEVEGHSKAAGRSVGEFADHRRSLVPRLRLCPPPQLELPGLSINATTASV